jgi:hypothetical protein
MKVQDIATAIVMTAAELKIPKNIVVKDMNTLNMMSGILAKDPSIETIRNDTGRLIGVFGCDIKVMPILNNDSWDNYPNNFFIEPYTNINI